MAKKKLHVAIVFNAYMEAQTSEAPEDRGSMSDLKQQVRNTARNLKRLGHTVTVLPLADDLFRFQRKLRRVNPDVVFNLYDDVVYGALYDMRLAALVRMMGYPMTGCPALAPGGSGPAGGSAGKRDAAGNGRVPAAASLRSVCPAITISL